MVNLFGHGFIGSRYAKLYDCIVNDRNDLTVKSKDILYLISTTDNYNVKTNPYIDIDTNLTTMIRVLENCKHMPDVTFNFASSWFVYGDSQSVVDETSYCDPKGFYSITKRTAEQLLISYCEAHKIKYRILRFANVVGAGDKNVSSKKNALTYMLRKLKSGEGITLYNNGEFYRDYIHVNDVCRAINLILTSGEINSIYNVGTGIANNFKYVIDYIIAKTNSTSTIMNVDSNATSSFYMNCDKIKKLGFVPRHDIYTIVDELLNEQY